MRSLELPKWAKVARSASSDVGKVSIVIDVDPDIAYPEWRALLEQYKILTGELTQYWLEVIYQCVKLDLQERISGTQYDPRIASKAAEFHFLNRPKWALSNFPAGRGIAAATKGREARGHYQSVRGGLPFTASAPQSVAPTASKPWWKVW